MTGGGKTKRASVGCAWSFAAPGSPIGPSEALARLASPRLRHQPRAAERRGRPVPPGPRHRRARHPGPERRSRPRALPLGEVLRQRRLARLRGARPQPHPLERPPRRHPPRRSADRGPHRAHPRALRARSPGQPQRPPRPATPSTGHGRRRSPERSIASARCRSSPDPLPRTGAAADHACADNRHHARPWLDRALVHASHRAKAIAHAVPAVNLLSNRSIGGSRFSVEDARSRRLGK